jgi:Leucine-rich repeat (LRR) protein
MGKKKRKALFVVGFGVCLVTIFFLLKLQRNYKTAIMHNAIEREVNGCKDEDEAESSDGVIARDEVLIQTQLEDVFVVKYETRNFPKILTTVEIYDLNQNKLGRYHLRDYFQEPLFPVLFDKPDLQIYQIPDGIIYKDRTGKFNGIQFTWLRTEEFAESPELVEVAKVLIETKEWRWLRSFGRFPVILRDNNVRNIFVRYSSGKFTKEELEVNQNSKITKAEMISFAQQVLEEYKRYELEIIDENKVITFADKNLERIVREKIGKPDGEIKFGEVQGITVLDASDLPWPRHRFHDVSNPEIHEKAIVSLDGLRYLTNLQELNLSRNPISDLSELKYLKKLTKLELRTIYLHKEGESDLSPLSELTNLKHLDLYWNHITDLSPLASLVNLESLDLSHNEINDLTPIANLTNLRKLDLSSNDLRDLSPLAKLTKLTNLYFWENPIEDITVLGNFTYLEVLKIRSTRVKNFDVLGKLGNLTSLSLAYNDVEDHKFLSKLKKLKVLDLSGNDISDISFLRKFTILTELSLANNRMEDISPLRHLTNLQKLDLSYNQITDLKPLLELKNLAEVYLDRYGTGEVDLAVIEELKKRGTMTYTDFSRGAIIRRITE